MLTTDNTVLLVVDVQGKLAQLMPDKETLFANIQRMIRGALALSVPILWVEQNPAKLGPTIVEIAELLPRQEPISKTSFSCAGNAGFIAALEGLRRKQVLVVGIEAHVCVYQTAVDLSGMGYAVEVVEDAVGSRLASNKSVGVRRMMSMNVALTSTEMALFELLRDSDHPAFRDVQASFK
ncbi:MAG: hydrolase [Halioglobus sp.]|nr:hydrolase [Halioglobus sp.]